MKEVAFTTFRFLFVWEPEHFFSLVSSICVTSPMHLCYITFSNVFVLHKLSSSISTKRPTPTITMEKAIRYVVCNWKSNPITDAVYYMADITVTECN